MAHALLSPSASHRWLHCTAAPRLEAQEPDEGSDYAREGTLAHAICENKLKSWLNEQGASYEIDDTEVKELWQDYYQPEMDNYTDEYVSIIKEKYAAALATTPDAKLHIEQRVDLTEYIPDLFGTADAIIIADGTMEVVDFKYGKGVRVDAYDNPQMKIYALGAWLLLSMEYNIETVKMTIVQPRMDNISEFELTATDLTVWGEQTLKPKAQEALSGGTQAAGEWCQFCKVKNKCRALMKAAFDAYDAFPDPALLTLEELPEALAKLPLVKTWMTGVEEYALGLMMQGNRIEGYKVVEGRSMSKIVDPESARNALNAAGYDDADILKPQELRTITDLEKLVGKKQFTELVGAYVEKPQGKPTIAKATDKRPEYNSVINDFKEF